MSLKYLGISSFCRHGGYEDKCEICALLREKERLERKVDYLIEQSRVLLEMIEMPHLTKFFEKVVFKFTEPRQGVTE